MASSEAEDQEHNPWEELLRKMLPEGAPLPDEDHLDYSISVDYVGPSSFVKPPINLMIPKTKFTTFPKQPPSLTPRNPTWLKSRSSSDTTNSDNKRLSSSSMAFDDAANDDSSDGAVGAVTDRYNPQISSRFDEGKGEMKRRDCASSGGNKNRGCRRCGKLGNGVLGGRERCIVCGAEYCRKCVLKAMGSMPEGRKCVVCIGKPIDERNRGRLGKGSRLLARLRGPLEVKQIMQVERECKANQVRPDHVTVNGRDLREEELDKLLGCPVPPRGLKPGRYWYDKDSGLWGKDGEKPEKIISSKLDVGGKLQTDASSGNTRVYMNGREITKVELRVLKLAKVQCPRDTHFWLYDDGSYEEEGQNNIKGYIWEKASIRFLCSLFSLPVPPASAHCTKEKPTPFSARLFPEYLEQQRAQKLLLLGLESSGTSTIFKQAKFIYTDRFTTEELQKIKHIIRSNTYRYLITLLEEMEHFEEEALLNTESAGLAAHWSVPGGTEGSRQCMYSVNQKINNFCDWLLDLLATGDVGTHSPSAIIDEIWTDPAIQETYKRIEELKLLPDVTKYFIDRVIEISGGEYEPSERDILLAKGTTPSNGLACIEFSFDDQSAISTIFSQQLKIQRPPSLYQLIHLSSKGMHDGCKWLEMFDSMNSIVFCVSLCEYDQLWTHSTTGLQQNKMLASRDFFESVARHSCFEGKPFLLLLTKYDLFEEKINHVPITVCEWFKDFNPIKYRSKSPSLAHQAYYYVAVKFKELYASITGGRLYVRQIQAHERTSVDEAFRYLREIVEWNEHNNGDLYVIDDEDSASCAKM